MSHQCPECHRDCDCEEVREGEDCSHCELPWDDEEHPDDEYESTKENT